MRETMVVPLGSPPLDAPTAVDRAGRRLWFGGAVFGVLTYLTWGTGHPLTLLLLPLTVPVTMVGAWIGGCIARMPENPIASDGRLIVPLLGVTSPLLMGLTGALWAGERGRG